MNAVPRLRVSAGGKPLSRAEGFSVLSPGTPSGVSCLLMLTLIEIGIMRIFEVVFFAGIAGCVVTILTSWYSIVKELAD